MTNLLVYGGLSCLSILAIAALTLVYLSLLESFYSVKTNVYQLGRSTERLTLINNPKSSQHHGYSSISSDRPSLYAPLSSRNVDTTSSGLLVRKVFFTLLAVANGFRFIGILFEMFNYLVYTTMEYHYGYMLLVILTRLVPTMIFFTVYSLISVFLAQLYYTFTGLPFFHVRNLWLLGNCIVYITIFVCLLFPFYTVVYWLLCGSYTFCVLFVSWYSGGISKIVDEAGTSSPIHLTKKIATRFHHMITTITCSMSISAVYYLLLAIGLVKWVPRFNETQFIFDAVLISCTDVIPSFLLIYIIGKRSSSLFADTVEVGGV